MENQHFDSRDAAGDVGTSSESNPEAQDYYVIRRRRFVAAMKGVLPISEYVKGVAADVERRLPPLPEA